MIFKQTVIKGAFIVQFERIEDERGFFARAFCKREFADHDIFFTPVQENIGYSKKQFTLRGLHYQVSPHGEQKLVRCIKGALYDVIVDMRPESPSFKRWLGIELTQDDDKMLYLPKGCAHGYQTLIDKTKIAYLVSDFYQPGAEKGVRWDDPGIGIEWKETENIIISDKDSSWPDFNKQTE